ncbi:Hypothetical predicted protein [Marmota monax]|uniref:Uncharacterized protein n=1 Tax=Marmota monax TaxID=9995 RepID=A0A5E4CEL6_MARMO|nr:hypothetical protein GHT09_010658 [Marmota monax]VTJ80288.1 Hypothetical predicted protein [Marmota monax]
MFGIDSHDGIPLRETATRTPAYIVWERTESGPLRSQIPRSRRLNGNHKVDVAILPITSSNSKSPPYGLDGEGGDALRKASHRRGHVSRERTDSTA